MKTLLPLLSLFAVSSVPALEVLGVVGPVVPAKPYYETLLSKQSVETGVKLQARRVGRAKKWAGDQRYNSGLAEGGFSPFALPLALRAKLTQPLCLIANDQVSKDWLAKSVSVLAEVKAICYLVKMDDDADLKSVRSVARGIPIYALDPTLIVDRFSVPFYPALISKRGVEQ